MKVLFESNTAAIVLHTDVNPRFAIWKSGDKGYNIIFGIALFGYSFTFEYVYYNG